MDNIDHNHSAEESPVKSALAIKACLDYLQNEASKLGMDLGSHMITVAASAVVEWIDRQGAETALEPAQIPETATECVILPWRRRAE